jgi:hypothetical protein
MREIGQKHDLQVALLLLFNLLFIWAAARSTNRQVPPPSLWIPFVMRQISKV